MSHTGDNMHYSNTCANCNKTLSQLSTYQKSHDQDALKSFPEADLVTVPLGECKICAIKLWTCPDCFEFLSSNQTYYRTIPPMKRGGVTFGLLYQHYHTLHNDEFPSNLI